MSKGWGGEGRGINRLARFSNPKNDTEFGAVSGFETFFAFNLVPYISGRAREHPLTFSGRFKINGGGVLTPRILPVRQRYNAAEWVTTA